MLPALFRWLLRRVGLSQPEWEAYRVLRERGELPPNASLEFAGRVRHSLGASWDRILSRPLTPLLLPAVALAAILLLSRGLSFSRYVLDAPGGLLVVHGVVVTFCLLVGAVILLLGRHAVSGRTARYWLFFVAKAVLTCSTVLLLWIEANGPLRAWILQRGGWRRLLAVPPGLLCIFLFGVAVLWCLADQRSRCPVCLRRLSLPTSLGSWASVFDPPSTELSCEAGHGTLNVAGQPDARSDHWTSLDASWRDLFHV